MRSLSDFFIIQELRDIFLKKKKKHVFFLLINRQKLNKPAWYILSKKYLVHLITSIVIQGQRNNFMTKQTKVNVGSINLAIISKMVQALKPESGLANLRIRS